MRATVEIDRLDDEVAHAYVQGFTRDLHFDDTEDDSRVMIYCRLSNGVWTAMVNETDEWLAEATGLTALARKLARRFGHNARTATVKIDDERR